MTNRLSGALVVKDKEPPFQLIWEHEVTDPGSPGLHFLGFRGAKIVYINHVGAERAVTAADSARIQHRLTIMADSGSSGCRSVVERWMGLVESALESPGGAPPRPFFAKGEPRTIRQDFGMEDEAVCRQWARSASRGDNLSWVRERLRRADVDGAVWITRVKRALKAEVLEMLVFSQIEPDVLALYLYRLRNHWGWEGKAVVGGPPPPAEG